MKKRYYISEAYCAGNLHTAYTVNTEAEAMEILKAYKEADEINSYMKIEEQEKRWCDRYWNTVRKVAEWWN